MPQAQNPAMRPSPKQQERGQERMQEQGRPTGGNGTPHEHRTAKIVELIGVSTKSFEDAIRSACMDAAESTRGITGAHVENFSVKMDGGKISEFKVNLKVAFGIERTERP